MSENLGQQFEALPSNLANHLLITVLPLLFGLLVSFPLAILAVRYRSLRYPILTVVSVIQTIPSLALLALMVPILVGVGFLAERWIGIEVSALGFYPTVVALTLYSMLPMLRNSVTGILGVDSSLKEAARGVGMTAGQSLVRVEIPLAMPVIIAGIRTATIWTVGIATLATPVGQRCLGNYIFRGLQTRNWTAVLFGCVAAALLAILLDMLIGGLQRAAEERRRRLAVMSFSGLAIVLIAGLIGPTIVERYRGQQPDGRKTVADASPNSTGVGIDPIREVVIGSKTFTEQYILAELFAQQLSKAGLQVRNRESLGSTVIFDGLVSGEIDCYVDYTGTIWANHMGRSGSAPPWKVTAEVSGWLAREHQVRALGTLGFENAYVLAMRPGDAERLGIRTIGDLAEHAAEFRFGSDYEFFGRPEWASLRDAYGLRFQDRISYDSTFMYEALVSGDVDVISAFSTDGRIAAYDLRVLDDPRQAIPPYDAIVLLSPRASADVQVVSALRPLVGRVTAETMRRANLRVDRETDKQTPAAAAEWLRRKALDNIGSRKGGSQTP